MSTHSIILTFGLPLPDNQNLNVDTESDEYEALGFGMCN